MSTSTNPRFSPFSDPTCTEVRLYRFRLARSTLYIISHHSCSHFHDEFGADREIKRVDVLANVTHILGPCTATVQRRHPIFWIPPSNPVI